MTYNEEISNMLKKESIFIIGNVFSVSGRTVRVKVNKNKNTSHLLYNGDILKNISVNSYIKITKGFISIIGKVEGEYIKIEKNFNKEYNKEEDYIDRYLEVSLFGHFENDKFVQGIKEMPLLDNKCYLLNKEEFSKLHQFYSLGEKTITIGTLTEEVSETIQISINKLFASHIGIFGNTGSGKSNTLAKVYHELFKEMGEEQNFKRNSKFIIIDFNGEYCRHNNDSIITSQKQVYNLTTNTETTNKYPILKNNIEKLEILSILLEATEKTQKPFLDTVLKNKYLEEEFEVRSKERIIKIIKDLLQNIERGINAFIDFIGYLEKIESNNEGICRLILDRLREGKLMIHTKNEAYYISGNNQPIYTTNNLNDVFEDIFGEISNFSIDVNDSFAKLKFKIVIQYYFSLMMGHFNQEHIKPLIGRMFKKFSMLNKIISINETIENSQHFNLQIINLKNVNLEMKKTLPLIISKQLYDEQKSRDNFKGKSLHIIIDEAHNILSASSERESQTWKDYRLETFEEIIKEGRKFNTFLTIASQRPYDISPTIISQLHNYFIHELNLFIPSLSFTTISQFLSGTSSLIETFFFLL